MPSLHRYLINFLLDATVGMLLIYAGVRAVSVLVEWQQWESLRFGEYGNAPWTLDGAWRGLLEGALLPALSSPPGQWVQRRFRVGGCLLCGGGAFLGLECHLLPSIGAPKV